MFEDAKGLDTISKQSKLNENTPLSLNPISEQQMNQTSKFN